METEHETVEDRTWQESKKSEASPTDEKYK